MTDYSGYSGYDQPRRRRHPLRWIIIIVVVLLAILIGVDFAAKSYAEGQMASQIQQQGFPQKPDVTIEGFRSSPRSSAMTSRTSSSVPPTSKRGR